MSQAIENVASALTRIDQIDPRVRAMAAIWSDRATSRAETLSAPRDAKSPLWGMPVAVKDNICTLDGKTTCASRILEDFQSPYAADVVERLERAGAIIVGKTNLDEFAMGSTTENSGLFPTLNPWNPEYVPGGSSGGSAAAVASRMVEFALGSDTGGSIRQPASFCGVCGLKPTYGRVSRYGLVAFASSLDQIGPLATNAWQLAVLLGVIAGHDSRDSTCFDTPVPDYVSMLNEPMGRLRIGVAAEYFGDGVHPETRKAVESAIETLKKLGAEVSEVRLPHTKYVIACYYLICTAEASSNLARFDGVRYGHRTESPKDYFEVYSKSRAEGFGAEVKRRIMLGTFALSSGYYDQYYNKALRVRTLIRQDFDRAFEQCDAILSPTTPTPAFKFGEKSHSPLEMYLTDIYNCAANLAGIPALSIPCGHTSDGMPIGLQLMGKHFDEAKLLQIAHQFQQVTDFHKKRPAICA
ncbi:MAG: Asp-tRNA(Asn)/Glu-tRNA(Gln) amidotransferase subunit GatA [Phycisphaerales bacterium]|nr:Asp-tRNA(Asn)/Glu-tRNA(Gln) amidotransferase subunit GatA [Phycisphaerales bacterium]MCB9863919.1 Asp-tRNA(Asn)/Glu-tRNA(Gln) amidotransferase subunit GatA [Phycisphaerales bacterium]